MLYDRAPITQRAPPAYKALHPSGTAPVITDDGLVLAELGAIIEYIVAKHGNGRLTLPADHPNFARFLYWYHFVIGSLMPCMMILVDDGRMVPMMRDRLAGNLAVLDTHFAEGHAWLAGDTFTIANIIILFPLLTMRAFLPIDLSPFPSLRAYLHRVTERPAFQAAKAKADPDLELQID